MTRSQLGGWLLVIGIVLLAGPKVKDAITQQSLAPITMDGWVGAGTVAVLIGLALTYRKLIA